MAKTQTIRFRDDRYYAPTEHMWVKLEDRRARIGLDALGCWAAGTIAHIDLQRPAKRLLRVGAAFGTLEANKFVGALRAPLRGTILAVNEAPLQNPRLLNTDPYGEGWLVVLEPTHFAEDLVSLVHGREAILRYASEKVTEYRQRGILPDDAEQIQVVVQ